MDDDGFDHLGRGLRHDLDLRKFDPVARVLDLPVHAIQVDHAVLVIQDHPVPGAVDALAQRSQGIRELLVGQLCALVVALRQARAGYAQFTWDAAGNVRSVGVNDEQLSVVRWEADRHALEIRVFVHAEEGADDRRLGGAVQVEQPARTHHLVGTLGGPWLHGLATQEQG